jgi:hypothetical protein
MTTISAHRSGPTTITGCRALEESAQQGTRHGVLRALTVTGGVITSPGV